MPTKIELPHFIDQYVHKNSSIIIEGYNHAIPMAAVNELVKSQKTGLTIYRQSADLVSDLLVKEGLVDHGVFGWAGSPLGGDLTNLSKANSSKNVTLDKLGHPVFSAALMAGAMGLDFIQIPDTSDTEIHDRWKYQECGNANCVRAITSDVCIAHVQQIDRNGNALFKGIRGGLEHSTFASNIVFLTVEEEVDEISPAFGDIVVPADIITYFGVVPGGAKPYSLHGYYTRDLKAMQELARILETSK